ncbi:MAG: acyl-CoA thioesterase [Bacteroidia bacterium]
MHKSKTQIRVRYAETDQMGVVYHGNFATYFEVARVEALRQLGLTYKGFEEKGIIMPVLKLTVNFNKPAKYDDLLTIETTIEKLPLVKMTFYFKVFNEKNDLLCTGETILAFIDKATNKPTSCPKELLDKLKESF